MHMYLTLLLSHLRFDQFNNTIQHRSYLYMLHQSLANPSLDLQTAGVHDIP